MVSPAEVSIHVTVRAHPLTTTDVLSAAASYRACKLGVVLAAWGDLTGLGFGFLLFNHNHLLGHSIFHHDLSGLNLALEIFSINDEFYIRLWDLLAHGNAQA